MTRIWTPRPGPLHAEDSGDRSDSDRLVLLHGFTQTRISWNSFIDQLDAKRSVCRIDAPGHGLSPALDEPIDSVARKVVQSGGPGTYVGYSMGARILIHAAVDATTLVEPRDVRRLVLIGGTAGLEQESERQSRRESDQALARSIERDGVPAFLEGWLRQPMFADLPTDDVELAARRANSVRGLVSSLTWCGVGVQESLWNRLASITVPTLIIAGSRDTKFTEIGVRMTAAIGANATFAPIDGAGHAVHLEKPREVAHLIQSWIDARD